MNYEVPESGTEVAMVAADRTLVSRQTEWHSLPAEGSAYRTRKQEAVATSVGASYAAPCGWIATAFDDDLLHSSD
ncbi:hypothetical protein OUZ56_001959 [Daphnia magna]|uniref:Uncharacterized protein n=1 Tax=Daphnia magna TaxID=35525 RepID=A0ABR0A498_9CRUS|nr:hypothetical protein OUZ56_001959 [Daphnia magna]